MADVRRLDTMSSQRWRVREDDCAQVCRGSKPLTSTYLRGMPLTIYPCLDTNAPWTPLGSTASTMLEAMLNLVSQMQRAQRP